MLSGVEIRLVVITFKSLASFLARFSYSSSSFSHATSHSKCAGITNLIISAFFFQIRLDLTRLDNVEVCTATHFQAGDAICNDRTSKFMLCRFRRHLSTMLALAGGMGSRIPSFAKNNVVHGTRKSLCAPSNHHLGLCYDIMAHQLNTKNGAGIQCRDLARTTVHLVGTWVLRMRSWPLRAMLKRRSQLVWGK